MKHLVVFLAAALFVAALPCYSAQQMKIVRKAGPGGTVTREFTQDQILGIPELAAMILEQGKDIVVDHIMEKEMRVKGYETTELKEGDKILMADGQRITSLKELRDHYEKAAPGATVKFGIKRGDEMVIASFVKADPKDLPKTRMLIAGGDDKEMLGIPQIGLILAAKGNDVVVDRVLENAAAELKGANLKQGDVIATLNTFAVKSFADFRDRYEKIPVGDKVELIAKRAGATQTVTFAKPKRDGKVIIRR
jgi:S1-C subfamily serine protease